MTRLRETDIEQVIEQIARYDSELKVKTGYTLAEIAAHAVGLQNPERIGQAGFGTIAVIPMTCGQGVISSFSETVAGILSFLGMRTFVTPSTDVKGMAEALEQHAEFIFIADDERFIGIHLKSGCLSDNSVATGKGYAAALDYLSGGLRERDVLILGAGPVGRAAAFSASDFGGKVHIYDRSNEASQSLAEAVLRERHELVLIEETLHSALNNHRLIIDATPEAGFITENYLYPDTCVAAPGMPLGVHPKALLEIQSRLIHDPLQLGVATMLYDLIHQVENEEEGRIR